MIQITQLHLSAGTDSKCLETKIRKNLRLKTGDSFVWEILRHSVDARKKAQLLDVYTAGVRLQNEKRERAPGGLLIASRISPSEMDSQRQMIRP